MFQIAKRFSFSASQQIGGLPEVAAVRISKTPKTPKTPKTWAEYRLG